MVEIGASYGACTATLLAATAPLASPNGPAAPRRFPVLAIELKAELLAAAKARCAEWLPTTVAAGTDGDSDGDVVFLQANPLGDSERTQATLRRWLTGRAAAAGVAAQPVAAFVDIGGNRELPAVLRVVDWVVRAATPATSLFVVVKSESLHDAARDGTAPPVRRPPRREEAPASGDYDGA